MTPDHERPREPRGEARRALARKVARNGARAFFRTLTRDVNTQSDSSARNGYGSRQAGNEPKVVG